MKVVSTVLALFVSLLIVGNLSAADEKKSHEGKRPPNPTMDRMEMFQGMVKGLNLTDEQKTKFESLKKEYGPKFKEGWKDMGGILTDEQKKAREEAVKAAKDAGKKGPEVWEAAKAAVKLTDEQKAKMAENRKAAEALHSQFREKLMDILTTEQKEQLKKEMAGKKDHAEKKDSCREEDCREDHAEKNGHEHKEGHEPESK